MGLQQIESPPLEDPNYEPKYEPVDGRPPEVVAKWGAPSQLRWFRRFQGLRLTTEEWEQFHCESAQHRGLCCPSCLQDAEFQGFPNFDDHCCCRAE
jgi:hypothetical protein